jgi:MFS family permease
LTQLVKGAGLAKDAQRQDRLARALLAETPLSDTEQGRVIEAVRERLASEPQLVARMAELKSQAAPAKGVTQIMISIGAIIGCLIAPLAGARFGRRPAYFGLCLLSLIVCAFQFRTLDTYDTLFIFASGVAGMVTAAFYGWLPLYLPELFPTRMRATGQGLSFNFGRILAGFGALYMGQLVHFLGGSYARAGATVTLIYALGLIFIWLAPETKGRPLPE